MEAALRREEGADSLSRLILPVEFSDLLAYVRVQVVMEEVVCNLGVASQNQRMHTWVVLPSGVIEGEEPFPSLYLLDHSCACYKDGNCRLTFPIKNEKREFQGLSPLRNNW